jgi:hypothetical protein
MQKVVCDWLKKGRRREMIMISLRQPMTAKQLSYTTGIREDSCSFILQEFLRYLMVTCLNRSARRSRLYWLTKKGRKYKQKLFTQQGLSALPVDFPVVDWELYGWVCYAHRTAIIKVITEPLQPAAIKRKILHQNPKIKISANNVSDILRLFLKKKIIVPVKIQKEAHLSYRLTELGTKLQLLLYRVENPYSNDVPIAKIDKKFQSVPGFATHKRTAYPLATSAPKEVRFTAEETD